MNSLDGVMVVGLTGQTGAGKTTVCKVFEENGFSIINADKIARQVMEKGSPCLIELSECFKENILNEDGSLNRSKLAKLVFTNKASLDILNSICYPYITSEILSIIRKHANSNNKLVLLDAPTLFESHADDFCEIVISVIATRESRLKRIIERDFISAGQAEERMNSQHTEKFFMENSDFIIKNNKDIKNLYDVSKEVSDKIKDYYNNNFKSQIL